MYLKDTHIWLIAKVIVLLGGYLVKCVIRIKSNNLPCSDLQFFLNLPQAKQLEEDVGPLQQSKKLLEEEKGSWVAEKTALKSEVSCASIILFHANDNCEWWNHCCIEKVTLFQEIQSTYCSVGLMLRTDLLSK